VRDPSKLLAQRLDRLGLIALGLEIRDQLSVPYRLHFKITGGICPLLP